MAGTAILSIFHAYLVYIIRSVKVQEEEGKSVSSKVWKFHDFSISQILHEINLRHSKSAKAAILTHLEALNIDFHEFLYF